MTNRNSTHPGPALSRPSFAISRPVALALLAALLCACGSFLAPSARAQDNAALVERARIANDERRFDDARKDLAVVLARSSWNEGALLEQARLFYFERNPAQAWETLSQLLHRDQYPRNVAGLNLRALLNSEWKKDTASALADLDSAVGYDPGFSKAYLNRARILASLGRFEQALADADKAIELAPENAVYRWERSRIHVRMKQPEKALADLDTAIERDAGNAGLIVERAWVRLSGIKNTGETEAIAAVKADIDRALQLKPDFDRAHALRGWFLHNTGPKGVTTDIAAFNDLKRAFQSMPDDPYVRNGLGRTAYAMFEEGGRPSEVWDVVNAVNTRFERSGYSAADRDALSWAFSLFPAKAVKDYDKTGARASAEYKLPDYLEYQSAAHPENMRLLYYAHANYLSGWNSPVAQAMRTVLEKSDKTKDASFAALAAIWLANARLSGIDVKPDGEKAIAYKEASELLLKAEKLDPRSPKVKEAMASIRKASAAFMPQAETDTKTATDMDAQLKALGSR